MRADSSPLEDGRLRHARVWLRARLLGGTAAEPGYHGDQLAEVHRLREVRLVARLQRPRPVLGVRVGGECERRDATPGSRGACTDRPDQRVTVFLRQADVAD